MELDQQIKRYKQLKDDKCGKSTGRKREKTGTYDSRHVSYERGLTLILSARKATEAF